MKNLRYEIYEIKTFVQSKKETMNEAIFNICINILNSCLEIEASRDSWIKKSQLDEIPDRLYKVYRLAR